MCLSEVEPAYSNLLVDLKKLTVETTSLSEMLVDLNTIVDTMDIVVDPQAHVESLQDQHEQLVRLAQQFREKIAHFDSEQRQRHSSALEKLTTRVESLRIKLIKAIENNPKPVAEGKSPVLKFGAFDDSIDWNDIANVDIVSLETTLIDIAMDLETNPPPQPEGEEIEKQMEEAISQAIANEQADAQTVSPSNESVEQNMVVQNPPPQLDQASSAVGTETISTMVAHVENGGVVKMSMENIEIPSGKGIDTQASGAQGGTTPKPKAIATFSYNQLKSINELTSELALIPALPEPATSESIRKLREYITHFIKTCEQKQVAIEAFAGILVSNIVAAMCPTTYQAWESHMILGDVTLASIREFLTNQEALLIDRKFTSDKFLLARAIRESKELIREQPKAQRKVETMDTAPLQPCGPNTSQATGAIPKIDYSSSKRGRSEVRGTGASKSRESSASMRNGKQRGNEQKRACLRCEGAHALFKCKFFMRATLNQRWNYVNSRGICPLCLQSFHSPLECTHGECKNHANDDEADTIHNSTLCEISMNKKQSL